MHKVFFYLVILLVNLTYSWGQTGNTIGLLQNDSQSYNGYTVLSPINSTKTFLIDNCGYVVNRWTSENTAALTAHITENGNLLRAGRVQGTFNAGGSGGFVQLYDWDNNLLWETRLSENYNYSQHHDVKPMPNGNILVLAWEYNSPPKAVQMGRIPDEVSNNGLWTEMLLEIEPIGTDDFNIVWEWHMNQHMIQEIDPTKDNYGIVIQHPELIDINFETYSDNVDRFHANAIDYNQELDQIVINSRNYNEFYIIDHSTTTEEAASHSGGNSNKGGDILYRYGNPASYQRGTSEDRKFYLQHGANWIRHGENKNGIIVFNNGVGRPQGAFSSIEIVKPEMTDGFYQIEDNEAFGPTDFAFAYVGSPTSSFYSSRLSNATVLPNQNILIAEGRKGRLFEITPDKEIVWEYINPALGNTASSQGDGNPYSEIFATHRYSYDYSGLVGDLTPSQPVEYNSDYDCEIYTEDVYVADLSINNIQLIQNPITDLLRIYNPDAKEIIISIVDLYGRRIMQSFVSASQNIDKFVNLPTGFYILDIRNIENNVSKTFKVIVE